MVELQEMIFIRKIFSIIRTLIEDKNERVQTRISWHKEIKILKKKHLKNCKVLSDRNVLLSCLPKKGVVAEIGVDLGNFTKEILNISKVKKLVLIDIKLDKELDKKLQTFPKKKVDFVLNDSVKALKKFPDKTFDWIYIDTSHEYYQTKKELSISKNKVKRGGYICGHDYILFSYTEEMKYGVVKAVNEFCTEKNWEIAFLTLEPHGYYSFALREIS